MIASNDFFFLEAIEVASEVAMITFVDMDMVC